MYLLLYKDRRANPLKHYLISTGNTLNILLLITQRETFWILSLICIFALTRQRYCGLNHSADYGVQLQLSEPSTEIFSSGSYSLEPISEPNSRNKLGYYPLINLTSNSDWVTLLEVRVGTDLSDLATELNVCSSTTTA